MELFHENVLLIKSPATRYGTKKLGDMNLILISILILAAAVVVLIIFARREATRHGTKTREEFVGIAKSVFDRTVRKQANLDKIMNLFAGKTELSNSEIRQALGVSSRTAVRYLDELEKEGKIEQIGKVGHAVTYRLR